MSIEEKFQAACNEIRKFSKKPPDNEMLQVYALYKQAVVGNCNIAKPNGDDMTKNKWDAWNGKKGLDASKAKEEYVDKIKALAPKYA